MRFGILGGYFTAMLAEPIAEAYERACARLADAGAQLDERAIPHATEIAAVYLRGGAISR